MALPLTVAAKPVLRLGEVASTALAQARPSEYVGSGSSVVDVGDVVGVADALPLALADADAVADVDADALGEPDALLLPVEPDAVGAGEPGPCVTGADEVTAARASALLRLKPTSRVHPANTWDWSLS